MRTLMRAIGNQIGIAAYAVILGAPLLAYAKGLESGSPENISEVICIAYELLSIVVWILGVIATLVFFWGLVIYVAKAEEEEGQKKGKFIMTWGLVAIFVLVSMWGILQILYNDFGFDLDFGTILLPTGDASSGGPCS